MTIEAGRMMTLDEAREIIADLDMDVREDNAAAAAQVHPQTHARASCRWAGSDARKCSSW
jgi:hypothetical protein